MMAKKDDKIVPIKSGIDPAIAGLLDIRDALGLRLNRDHKPLSCLENVVTILERVPEWSGVLAFNEFSNAIEPRAKPPFDRDGLGEWGDIDDDETDLSLSRGYDMRPGRDICARAVGIVARRNRFHPVREFLDALTWDGRPRLATWLQHYLGAQVPEGDRRSRIVDYYAKVGTWWLLASVARVMQPGCKADHVPVLEGAQGGGKSTTVRVLYAPWVSETPMRLGDKDSYGATRGVWGYELAELISLNRAESIVIKGYLTAREDRYRPPYGRREIVVPRQTIFVGTTNADVYLRDMTGNRRFWPIRCGEIRALGVDGLEGVREQLWAEALTRYRAGESWYPTSREDVAMFAEEQDARELGDVWEALIEEGTKGRIDIDMAAIFRDVLDIDPGKMTRAEQIRVGECMARLGWTKKRTGPRHQRAYVYVRKLDEPTPQSGGSAPAEEGHDDIPF